MPTAQEILEYIQHREAFQQYCNKAFPAIQYHILPFEKAALRRLLCSDKCSHIVNRSQIALCNWTLPPKATCFTRSCGYKKEDDFSYKQPKVGPAAIAVMRLQLLEDQEDHP